MHMENILMLISVQSVRVTTVLQCVDATLVRFSSVQLMFKKRATWIVVHDVRRWKCVLYALTTVQHTKITKHGGLDHVNRVNVETEDPSALEHSARNLIVKLMKN